VSYLSAKQWPQKINLATRYLEFLQSDKAGDAYQEQISNETTKWPIGGGFLSDGPKALYEQLTTLQNNLKLNEQDFNNIYEKILGPNWLAQLKLTLSYTRVDKWILHFILGILADIGKDVGKDLKV
jgi:hypothetical protein